MLATVDLSRKLERSEYTVSCVCASWRSPSTNRSGCWCWWPKAGTPPARVVPSGG
jgi:hypothetical protein